MKMPILVLAKEHFFTRYMYIYMYLCSILIDDYMYETVLTCVYIRYRFHYH